MQVAEKFSQVNNEVLQVSVILFRPISSIKTSFSSNELNVSDWNS